MLERQITFLIVTMFKWVFFYSVICGWLWFLDHWANSIPMHMCNVCDHTHAHKDPQSRQSVRISISFNVTRPNMFPEVLPYWNKSFYKTEPEGTGLTPGTPAASTAYLFSRICYSVTAGLSQVKSFKCPILYLSRLSHHEQMSGTQNL